MTHDAAQGVRPRAGLARRSFVPNVQGWTANDGELPVAMSKLNFFPAKDIAVVYVHVNFSGFHGKFNHF